MDEIRVALDTVSGCSLHPYLNLLAVGTGHRRYPMSTRLSDDGQGQADRALLPVMDRLSWGQGTENVMRVFRMGHELLPVPVTAD